MKVTRAMMDAHAREMKIRLAGVLYDGFYRCPTTGRVVSTLPGDDKVLCGCGVSNPRVPTERTELTGVHIARFLERVGPEDSVDEKGE